ncbi:unnamed protein product [Allacma fusca]|uniref:RNA-binding protein 25 n=1 Tax=Allacma fusca TaxID=39272 RepID=A0A8J2JH75_9HEXA|nr:unnamed protein product [Allacma fusca]
MSFPPRPPMVPGMPMPFMGLPGMPPGMPVGIPPPMMGGPPPGGNGPPMQFFSGGPGHPRPGMQGPPLVPPPVNTNVRNRPVTVSKPPVVKQPEPAQPSPQPVPSQPSGPPVTVFVGNITEKWPDAMIRQLLATCGQVVNWKRVQGASGKLQGFGFCEFNGPDAGLRAVRLLHELEVGDKKLVVKVDAKTSSVLEEFKAERKKRKAEGLLENKTEENDKSGSTGKSKKTADGHQEEDYMDNEMKEADERSRVRIGIIFREFKNELDAYVPPGGNEKPEKDSAASKQQIQDKLHLLKLSSLDKNSSMKPPDSDDLPEDLALEEGKREIITREISNFRENMKQEKQKEEERKKIYRERRERERARDERRKEERGSPERIRRDRSRSRGSRGRDAVSPARRRSRSRSDEPSRRDRNRDREDRDRGRDRDRERDRDRRRRSRDRRSRSKSRERERERSPPPPPKPRYREREEEEEAAEQKRIERKAREKEAAYEERLRAWEMREQKKAKEIQRDRERVLRIDDDQQRNAKRMKQFLEDYDDEKHDSKYYKGKELQRRLADRAKELEADNKDRQREREELEDIKLRMLTSNATPPGGTPLASRFDKYKKPMSDSTNTSLTSTPTYKTAGFAKIDATVRKSPIASRLQALASNPSNHLKNGNAVTQNIESSPLPRSQSSETMKTAVDTSNTHAAPTAVKEQQQQQPPTTGQQTSFSAIQFSSFVPISKSNPTTPNSTAASPAVNVAQMSPSLKSLAGTGFQITLNSGGNPSKDEDSRNSFPSPAVSGGMPSPAGSRDDDDFSAPGFSPADLPKKKKMDVRDVFNQDEDDNDGFGSARKRKLVPLDFDEPKKGKKDDKIPEDKKKHIKSLIEKIPTDKAALFAHEIDWDMLDNTLMEKRIRPWINKKIIDYIGEPEPTLVDFICSKVLGRSAPQSILDDVMMVLDDEAEVFVVKMWRLLVYEIAAKKLGGSYFDNA